MNWEGLAFQALDGLASASGLFFVAAGLSLIFGVTRIINIAHGSLYMLGTYIAVTLVTAMGGSALGFWGGIIASAIIVGVIGALIEVLLLRRVYTAPELFQLLATFALLLVINDATLWLWGPEDLLGPRAPGLRGAIEVLGRNLPSYDAFLIVVAPIALGVLHIIFARTRFGRLVRAATEDRDMLGALGVNQSVLFTAVFALGALLAGLGGALQVAREPADLGMDLTVITDAFVVVVVGGMGSIVGSYIAAVLIAEVKALCIGLGLVTFGGFSVNFSKFTLVAEFLVMAIVLIARPHGLLGRPQVAARGAAAEPEAPIRPASRTVAILGVVVLLVLIASPLLAQRFTLCLGARRRCADRGAVRHQPAFHHGPGRHGLVRPRRLFRPRRLRCRFGGEMARRADGPRSRRGSGRGRAWRVAVRLVRGPSVRCLSRHAHARLCPDCLVDRFPMAGVYRRLQWRARRLAERSIRSAFRHSFFSRLCSSSPAFCCCGACCSRRSATPCAPAAIRRCGRRRSAST